MIRQAVICSILISAVAQGVAAQSLSVTGNADHAFCADRPEEPETISEIPMRQSHKRILAQRMYTEGALTAVVESEDCSCDVRFPSWGSTVEQYLELYAGIDDRHEVLALVSERRRSINDLRNLARPICVEIGNW